MAAILNDIKTLFDVHNTQTIPDLGVKFQTYLIHTLLRNRCPRKYGQTYVRTEPKL